MTVSSSRSEFLDAVLRVDTEKHRAFHMHRTAFGFRHVDVTETSNRLHHRQMIVVGRGIAGLATSLALRRAAKISPVTLIGERHNVDVENPWIGLWTPAIKCLAALKVFGSVRRKGRFMTDGEYRSAKTGRRLAQPSRPLRRSEREDANDIAWSDPALFFVKLSDLLDAFEGALDDDGGVRRVDERVVGVRRDSTSTTISLSNDSTIGTNAGIVVADGTFSETRAMLGTSTSIRYRGYDVYRGSVSRRREESPECYQAWGLDARFATVPIPGNAQQWFCTMTMDVATSQLNVASANEVEAVVQDFYGARDIREAIRRSGRIIRRSAYESDGSVRDEDLKNVFYAGDAARTLDPILAVGAGLAIEDAFEIAHHASGHIDNALAVSEARDRRIRRLRWLSDLSQAIGQMSSSTAMHVRDGLASVVPTALSGPCFDRFLGVAIDSPGEALVRVTPAERQ